MCMPAKSIAVFIAAALLAQPAFALSFNGLGLPSNGLQIQLQNYGRVQAIHSNGLVVTNYYTTYQPNNYFTTYHPNYMAQVPINPIAYTPPYQPVTPAAAPRPAAVSADNAIRYCGGYISGTIVSGVRQSCPVSGGSLRAVN